jgi:hypothetical protein
MFYGAAMPAFLESFPPVAQYGYLPDIARLELALRHAYHAADARPLDPSSLSIQPEALMAARFGLAPAVRVIASRWPIHAIWRANTDADAPKPVMRPEEVLIARPGFDPRPWLLPPGGAALISALHDGRTLAEALQAAGEDFDFSAALASLLAAGALTTMTEGTDHAPDSRVS